MASADEKVTTTVVSTPDTSSAAQESHPEVLTSSEQTVLEVRVCHAEPSMPQGLWTRDFKSFVAATMVISAYHILIIGGRTH